MLSSEMDDPGAKQALGIVRPRDFFRTEHRYVFASITALAKDGFHFGLEAVVTHLDHKKRLNGSFSRTDVQQMTRDASRGLPIAPVEQALQVRALGERREAFAAWKVMGQTFERIEDPVRLRARMQEILT